MLIEVLIYSLIPFSFYLLSGLSFSIVYSVIRFFNILHGILFVTGAYITYSLIKFLHFPLIYSIILAVIANVLIIIFIEITYFKKLRLKKATQIILLLSSLGLYTILQNIISLIFGNNTKSIRTWEVREGINVLGAYITPIQIVIIITSIVLVFLVASYLNLTKTGRAMRAVASDNELSKFSGIKSDRIILIAFAIGSALAGIAGILVALDVNMSPTMGMNMLLMGVVAMIIGGVGSIWGIVLGSLLLAAAQNLGVWYISSQWMDAIAFGILLIFLLFRPQGFFGKKLKKAEV